MNWTRLLVLHRDGAEGRGDEPAETSAAINVPVTLRRMHLPSDHFQQVFRIACAMQFNL